MRTLDSYVALCKAYRAAGTRIDALTWHIHDEWERFQSYLIQGPDGHVFWNGNGPDFTLNASHDKSPRQRPVYYWWRQIYGKRAFRLVSCPTSGCISPYHARLDDVRGPRERLYPDHAILGAIQVWALKHGHAPGKNEWDEAHLLPSTTTIHKRFGSFENAVSAAGLEPRRHKNARTTADAVLAGLHEVARELGQWPKYEQYRTASVGRFAAPFTLRTYFGTYGGALEAARARYPSL